MTKFHGMIGFVETTETVPGVWTEVYVEKEYYGNIIKNTRRIQGGSVINDNLTINNQISVLTDEYLGNNFGKIRYVERFGSKWKVESVDPDYPRSVLTLGGLYNVESITTTESS